IRPCNIHAAIPLLISRPSDCSFPSGHTAVAVTGAATLFFSRREIADPKRRKYICLLTAVLAGLIAFSRLYLYVHYPTDVLAGALLGMMMGWMGSKAANLLPEKMEGLLWKHNLQD
ncbi:MAG: phosphatase PAP2 family protein, partial [Eubacteriaceae bacterium]|nr:phosphatase PAP2 family protein [Eubacteriaceae bacterium]